MKGEQTCYMCTAPATSREHVPPKCLFPEPKDLPGTNYRDNPIIVSSCDVHNFRKSKDDEYLMDVLPVYFLNDPVAKKHVDKKVLRALKRRSKLAVELVSGGGSLGCGLAALGVDTERILNSCDHIVRGLYFEQYGRKWMFPLELFSCAFIPTDPNLFESFEKCRVMEREIDQSFEQNGTPYGGAHPEIFKFRFLCGSERVFYVQIFFYGAVLVSGVGKRGEVFK